MPAREVEVLRFLFCIASQAEHQTASTAQEHLRESQAVTGTRAALSFW